MTSPVIGMTTRHGKTDQGLPDVYLLQAYLDSIVRAGGVPVLIPSDLPEGGWQALYGRLDGILLTGGGDIATEHFGGEPHPRISGVDPLRDALELALLQASAGDGKPFLGICRGCQVVNVALGGTLYTHIGDQLPGAIEHDYRSGPRDYLAHDVEIGKGTQLARILGETTLAVNSLHHQGVKGTASVLKPVACAPDGLVEAVELPNHPFGIAIQWHPEWLVTQPASQRLFQAFVDSCKTGAQK